MNTSEPQIPDFRMPSAARMYDYFLGGKDHFQADREMADRVMAAYPEVARLAQANRRFLTRAVWYLAEHGITQYVDFGCGMPTSPTVHEIARQLRPDARVVYVDNDPVVASHYRAACNGDAGLAVLELDIRATQEIFNHWQFERTIDLAAPIAFLCAAVLHFIPDDDQPKGVVAALRWRMVPGSYLVISHALIDDASKDLLSEITDSAQGTTSPPIPRTATNIGEFFTGLDLVEPGLVDVSQWRPDEQEEPTKIRFLAGLGRKPRDLPDRPPNGHAHLVRKAPSGTREIGEGDMDSQAIRRSRTVPKYVRVGAVVRAQIEDGILLPGEPVPSGAALSRATGYSVLTCRRALRVLIQDGVLVSGASPGARPRVPARTPAPGDQNLSDAVRALSAGLATRRRTAGLTQPELAKILDLSVTTIGHAETGRVWQSRPFWECADKVVNAEGELLALHDAYRAATVATGLDAVENAETEDATDIPEAATSAVAENAAGTPETLTVTVPGSVACVTITWADGAATAVYPPHSASPAP